MPLGTSTIRFSNSAKKTFLLIYFRNVSREIWKWLHFLFATKGSVYWKVIHFNGFIFPVLTQAIHMQKNTLWNKCHTLMKDKGLK